MFARWHWTFDLKSCKEFSKRVPRYILLKKFRSFRDSVPLYSFISFLHATETTTTPLQVIRVTVTKLGSFSFASLNTRQWSNMLNYFYRFLTRNFTENFVKSALPFTSVDSTNYFFLQARASIVRSNVGIADIKWFKQRIGGSLRRTYV